MPLGGNRYTFYVRAADAGCATRARIGLCLAAVDEDEVRGF